MENNINELLNSLNEKFREQGLCELAYVSPKDCLAQQVNARYMKPEIFQTLVGNIKTDNRLESTPLVYRDGEKYRIISGHHRVDAAKEGGLEFILVLVTTPKSADEIVSKQLSHNSLVGIDDENVLNTLFQSIENIELKLRTGLQDAQTKISIDSLNFKVGIWKDFSIVFLPEDLASVVKDMEIFAKDIPIKSSDTVLLANEKNYNDFCAVLRKVKKNENIKANATAFVRMVELAKMQLKQMKDDKGINDTTK